MHRLICFYIGETPSITESVTGGLHHSIQWPTDKRFKMDILPNTFPSGHQVNISVSLLLNFQHHNIPDGHKRISPTYQVTVSEELKEPMMITIKHNAIVTNAEEAKTLAVLHQRDNGTVEILQGTAAPKTSYIMFQSKELSKVTTIVPENTATKYHYKFYRKRRTEDNCFWSIRICISVESTCKVCSNFKFYHPLYYYIGM